MKQMDTWNRDDEWEVQRTFHERASIYVTINTQDRPAQMASLRRLVPSLGELSPSQLRDRIDERGRIEIEDMEGRIARKLTDELLSAGLEVDRVDTSVVSVLPFNRTHSFAWLIEDPAESKRIADEMISAGVPVAENEA